MKNIFSTRIDMTGRRFGKWTVLEYAYNDKGNQAHWRCRCDCGNIVVVSGKTLRAGLSTSCGCRKSEYTRKQKTIPHKFIDGKECKRCRICKDWKEIQNFSRASDRWDGLSKDCKSCLVSERISKRESRRPYMRQWANNKYKTDIDYRVKSSVQARIRGAIKNNYKAASTAELIGCSVRYLVKHLESLFQSGMNWDNYGEWHIDHIVPCVAFDLSDPEQQRICFHYTNLQPLWMLDNVTKGGRYES